jgi:hypothetical protein
MRPINTKQAEGKEPPSLGSGGLSRTAVGLRPDETKATPLPFEQQAKESAKAFAAFREYLDLGPQRSLAAVGKKLGKSQGLMERWSSKFDWPARVQAHAAQMAMVERKAAELAAALYGADREKRRELEREDEWVLRTELMEAGRKALEKFRKGERGATLGDVARALDIAAKLGRLSAGMKVDESEKETEGPDVNVLVAIDLALDKIYGVAEEPKGVVVEVEEVGKNAGREAGQ